MADRTVVVKLKADISDYTSGLAKAATETRSLGDDVRKNTAPGMRKAGESAGDEFGKGVQRSVRRGSGGTRKAGQDQGGILAQGLQLGVLRNSPLIAAAVGGALAAGAPAVLAGAGVMFAGIGAAAVAQTADVRSAWKQLGEDIKAGTAEDAAAITPVVVGMAQKLAAEFEALRPGLRLAFAESAPQIDHFTDSITAAADTAVPALERALANGAPVMDALGGVVEDIGAGVAGLLDTVSAHGPAAATALASIGQIVAELLPSLGTFLGSGTELASVVLPPLASVLGVVADVLQRLEPILPGVVASFAAMKGVNALTGWLKSGSTTLTEFAQKAAFATYSVDGLAATASGKASEGASRFATGLNKVTDGVGKASAALPALGVVLTGIAGSHEQATSKEEQWATALLAGGDAAKQAYADYSSGTHWGQALDEATGLSASWGDAKAKADEMRASMSPLQLAQAQVTAAQNNLQAAVDKFGENSPQAIAAAQAYKAAQAEVAGQAGRTQMAISGVTQAMIDQASQALAQTDSTFAYRQAQLGVAEAAKAAAEATRQNGAASTEAKTAGLAYEQALYAQAKAAGQLASDALPASASELEHNKAATQGTLAELYKLRDQMGSAFPASLQTTIANLEASGTQLDRTASQAQHTAGRMKDLGLQVVSIPNTKEVQIKAPTADQKKRLEDLGYTVRTLPNGNVVVTANTSPARSAVAAFVSEFQNKYIQTHLTATYAPISGPRAAGGPVTQGNTYLVGERGPELVKFGGSGFVTPAHITERVLATGATFPGLADGGAVRGREFSGGGAAGGGGVGGVSITGARLTGTLDLGGGLTGIIDARIADTLTYAGTAAG